MLLFLFDCMLLLFITSCCFLFEYMLLFFVLQHCNNPRPNTWPCQVQHFEWRDVFLSHSSTLFNDYLQYVLLLLLMYLLLSLLMNCKTWLTCYPSLYTSLKQRPSALLLTRRTNHSLVLLLSVLYLYSYLDLHQLSSINLTPSYIMHWLAVQYNQTLAKQNTTSSIDLFY